MCSANGPIDSTLEVNSETKNPEAFPRVAAHGFECNFRVCFENSGVYSEVYSKVYFGDFEDS